MDLPNFKRRNVYYNEKHKEQARPRPGNPESSHSRTSDVRPQRASIAHHSTVPLLLGAPGQNRKPVEKQNRCCTTCLACTPGRFFCFQDPPRCKSFELSGLQPTRFRGNQHDPAGKGRPVTYVTCNFYEISVYTAGRWYIFPYHRNWIYLA
jgi:hypothetical protein